MLHECKHCVQFVCTVAAAEPKLTLLLLLQVHARAHLPSLEDKNGVHVEVIDTYGTRHRFRYCSWINNSSRMYLLEGVAPALVRPPCPPITVPYCTLQSVMLKVG